MECGEVHCAEWPKEASFNRGTVNISKMGGDRVMDKEFLRVGLFVTFSLPGWTG